MDVPRFRIFAAVSMAGLVAAVALSGAGCTTGPKSGPIRPVVAVASAAPLKGKPKAAPPTALADAINDHGFDLVRSAVASDGPKGKNVVISPLSVHDALAMTANGAAGETLGQMRTTLKLKGMSEEASNQAWADLLASIGSSGETTLSVVNALWAGKKVSFLDPFLEVDRSYFGAQLSTIDLGKPEEAAAAINRWAARHTRGRIDNVIKPDQISEATLFFLTNATYFKGQWEEPFDEEATEDDTFHPEDGSSVKVPMMSQGLSADYLETPEMQAVRLPYKGGQVAMYVMLPAKAKGLSALEASLSAGALREIRDRMADRAGRLWLPRFTTRFGRKLNDDLKALGMPLAFDSRQADFSRMADLPPALRALHIGFVTHDTFLAVDEKGTEAAAVTVVEERAGGAAPLPPKRPFEMRVDRPFLCLIVHEPSGAVLFSASIRNPAPKGAAR